MVCKKLMGSFNYPQSRVCTVCGKKEYEEANIVTTIFWLCPDCLEALKRLLGKEKPE